MQIHIFIVIVSNTLLSESMRKMFPDYAICVSLRAESIFVYSGFAIGKTDLSSISHRRVTLDQVFTVKPRNTKQKRHEDAELDLHISHYSHICFAKWSAVFTVLYHTSYSQCVASISRKSSATRKKSFWNGRRQSVVTKTMRLHQVLKEWWYGVEMNNGKEEEKRGSVVDIISFIEDNLFNWSHSRNFAKGQRWGVKKISGYPAFCFARRPDRAWFVSSTL